MKKIFKKYIKNTMITLLTFGIFFLISNTNVDSKSVKKNSTFVISPDINIVDPGTGSGGGITYDTLDLNTEYEITLLPNEFDAFEFYPTTNGYYTIETKGNYDTKLEVYFESDYSRKTDDNSGTNNNSKIEFQGEVNERVQIHVSLNNETGSATFKLQIRRQKFIMFGGNYSDINTSYDLKVPNDCFKNLYNCVQKENATSLDGLSNDERNFAAINSEMVLFSGHGGCIGLSFSDGTSISIDSNLSLENTKIALWSSCESANNNNIFGISFAKYAFDRGAKCSIGFEKSIFSPWARIFSDCFYKALSEGKNAREAVNSAISQFIFLPLDNIHSCVIFGDDTVTAIKQSETAAFSMRNIDYYNQILTELDSDYQSYYIFENTYRYYKTIDGYITNSYIDLTFDGDNVIALDDHRMDISEIKSINSDYLALTSPSVINESGNNLMKIEDENVDIIYYGVNGIMTPVKIVSSFYDCGDEKLLMVYCFDLTNGNHLDYVDICVSNQ